MEMSKKYVYKLTLSAIFVALATVLSLIKVYKLPLGGAVTLLSMLPIVMLSDFLAATWGEAAPYVSSFAQLAFDLGDELTWGLTPASLVGTIFLDYIFAFTVLGLAGLFAKKGYLGICFGSVLVMVLRFLCHFVSGIIIFDIWCEWDSVWLYSLCYNGSFMLPELILTTVAAVILFRLPQVKKIMNRQ